MRDHDVHPYIVIERHGAGFGTFLLGLAIGAGAALLLAPRTGAETRDEIRGRLDRARSAAEDGLESARSTVSRTRDRFEDRIDSVRDQIGNVRDRLEARAEDAREAIDRRRGPDPDALAFDDAGMAASDLDGEVDIVVTEIFDESGRDDLIV